MDWGKANRVSKVIKPDGKCFYLAMDHGYFQGPTSSSKTSARQRPRCWNLWMLCLLPGAFCVRKSPLTRQRHYPAGQRRHQHGRR